MRGPISSSLVTLEKSSPPILWDMVGGEERHEEGREVCISMKNEREYEQCL